MPIPAADAKAAHKALHNGKSTVTISTGEKLTVEKNDKGCRLFKFEDAGVQAVEQNKKKPSQWAEKAKKGAQITWFIAKGGGSPSNWGRMVAGEIETHGTAIEKSSSGAASSTSATKKRPAAAVSENTEDAPTKKPRTPAASASSSNVTDPVAKKTVKEPAKVSSPAAASASDPLGLSPLFSGSGHGATWEPILRPIIEASPDAASFIGPGREKRIVPVRELTFQALKPNPPSGWRVISFGQSPYPRIESATGIAHFDNALKSWDDSRFGSIVTMRCIIKTAAMDKYRVAKSTSTQELRDLMKSKETVGPSEWFQAMLTQGVLFMNAACTLLPPEDNRAGAAVEPHRKFWEPTIKAVVKAILQDCHENNRGVVFAWWGSESLKTKSKLKACFDEFPKVKVEHIDSKNPAAMGDAFCDEPNVFKSINNSLKKLKLPPVDWLPSHGWKDSLKLSVAEADQMGDFIAETQDLHKMYLERLRDGLDISGDELADITGISELPLVTLSKSCKELQLEKAAMASASKAKVMDRDELTVEEAGAIHLYTTNFLYKLLNEALRSLNRLKVKQYFLYLRLFLAALEKLPKSSKPLYRGVALDLSEQYKPGSQVIWWAVSSCTPDLKVASSFSAGAKQTLFIISASRSVGIRKFSQYKNEEEFILAPGTEFEVTKVNRKGKLTEIHLRELDKPRRVR